MSKEYIQALDDLFGLVAFLPRESFKRAQKYFDVIEPALQRLEAIDNANSSEAMEVLNCNPIIRKEMDYEDYYTINKALIKSQEQEKVLEIIFENNVDIKEIKMYKTLHDYNCHILARDYLETKNQLTEEEFDLLKRWRNEKDSIRNV